MTSLLARDVLQVLKACFPNNLIKSEHFVLYKSQKLFFDFFMPHLAILIEVQGIQHYEFNRHFHGSADAFKAYKHRDLLKEEWAELNDFVLIKIRYDEIPITTEELLAKIEEKQNG